MKNILSTVIASVFASEALAETVEPATGGLLNDPLFPLHLTAAAVFGLLVLVAIVCIHVIRVLNFLNRESGAHSIPKKMANAIGESGWKRFIEKINASVPVEQEKDIVLDHSYDGIRELDNHLPPWWKWLFYGAIGWGVVYMIVFHVTDSLPLSQEEYKRELALAEEQVRKFRASQPQAIIDENALEYTADAAAIEKGKSIFMNNNCGGCHRNDGGGNSIGPNLTDEYWLHGGDITDVFRTIKNGVVEKGMPAWGKAMTAQDVHDLTFFVMSLQGTNPPEGKTPQGEIFKEAKTTSGTLQTKAGL